MGPTLIEDRTDEGTDPSRDRDGQCVRQRLWGAVSRVAVRLLEAVTGALVPAKQPARAKTRRDAGTEKTPPREAVAIRPSGQARLESGPADSSPDRSPDHADDPAVAARVTGDRLRVYDTENDQAYITSDTYKRCQR